MRCRKRNRTGVETDRLIINIIEHIKVKTKYNKARGIEKQNLKNYNISQYVFLKEQVFGYSYLRDVLGSKLCSKKCAGCVFRPDLFPDTVISMSSFPGVLRLCCGWPAGPS